VYIKFNAISHAHKTVNCGKVYEVFDKKRN